ncbi:unnamed protein product, partial [Mesorhabditis spiculigera]
MIGQPEQLGKSEIFARLNFHGFFLAAAPKYPANQSRRGHGIRCLIGLQQRFLVRSGRNENCDLATFKRLDLNLANFFQ